MLRASGLCSRLCCGCISGGNSVGVLREHGLHESPELVKHLSDCGALARVALQAPVHAASMITPQWHTCKALLVRQLGCFSLTKLTGEAG